uniref:Uncharacterized protein n=1 Tax=Bionectria ochroleuca TaxID=29856 RepID=A0A8H7TP32_BIOOC
MTMTMDAQQRFGPTMNLEYPHHSQAPTFSNPWSSSSSTSQPAPSSGLFGASQQPPPLNPNLMAGKPPPGRAGSSLGSYATMPVTTSADLLGMNRLPTTAPYADASYTTSAGPVAGQFPTSSAPYDALGYAPAPVRPTQFSLVPDADRKYSSLQQQHADERRGFADALDASHGMLAMSQETPATSMEAAMIDRRLTRTDSHQRIQPAPLFPAPATLAPTMATLSPTTRPPVQMSNRSTRGRSHVPTG